jgi:formylglycine-generating enzyme required for sulfatase activity/tRNA A-37 threonylcarbamoyl transferase component Bud32
MSNQIYHLPQDYQLQEYQIQSVLGAGGFGVTYLAIDTHLDAKVAIKEFFPSELAIRESGFTVHTKLPKYKEDFQWGLQRFIQESKILAQLRHPNIVRVVRFLQANHTAYLVMEYEEGDSLSELIGSGEKATEEEVLAILLPLLSGLQQMHEKGILHRDIKPANIYIRSDNSPVLLDFGSARYDVESRSRSVTAIVTPGYAPFEQYESKAAAQGAWTDIYAMGAVAYRLISGTTPPEAPERIGAVMRNNPDPLVPAVQVGKREYSNNLLQAIDWALKVTEKERPQSVAEWENALVGGQVKRGGILKNRVAKSSVDKPVYTKPVHQEPRSVSFFTWLILVLSLIIFAGYWGMQQYYDNKAQQLEKWVDDLEAEGERKIESGEMPTANDIQQPVQSEKRLIAGEVFQDTLKDGGLAPKMVVIPKGSFKMGDIQGGGDSDEKPVHHVTIDYDFAMSQYEVTFDEYDKFCEATGREKPSDSGWGRGNRPVINVSWNDAKAYAKWLSEQTGRECRLPTEAEWEYAARAGTETKYWWGNEVGRNNANCDGCGSQWDDKQTAPVGSFKANPFGLYDMNGNVWEWIEDSWHENYNGAPTDGSARKKSNENKVLLRGGSWYDDANLCRSADRVWDVQGSRFSSYGVRLVCSVHA